MADAPLIAVVDDDPSIRNATRNLLKSAGFSTATFESAAAFLASPSRARTACLVVDLRMPGMSGIELYQALVASGDGFPTVMITAHPEEATQSRALAMGIRYYLSKPFAPDDLLDCVSAALAKS